MACLLKDADLLKTVNETEERMLEKSAATDLVLSLNTELLTAIKAKVQKPLELQREKHSERPLKKLSQIHYKMGTKGHKKKCTILPTGSLNSANMFDSSGPTVLNGGTQPQQMVAFRRVHGRNNKTHHQQSTSHGTDCDLCNITHGGARQK